MLGLVPSGGLKAIQGVRILLDSNLWPSLDDGSLPRLAMVRTDRSGLEGLRVGCDLEPQSKTPRGALIRLPDRVQKRLILVLGEL